MKNPMNSVQGGTTYIGITINISPEGRHGNE